MNKELLRTVKFVLFSASAGIIQAISYWLFLMVFSPEKFELGEGISNALAITLSVLWNFTLNRKFTFQSASNIPLAMAKVALFYLVFIPLSSWWTEVLTNIGWNAFLVLALTMLINFVTEYLYQRFFVFGKSIDTAKK